MARYSIEDTTLTAIGDAIRGKVGETKIVTEYEEKEVAQMKVSKTPNATSFNTWEGNVPSSKTTDVITLDNVSKMKVKLAYQTYGTWHNVVIYDNVTGYILKSMLSSSDLKYEEYTFNTNSIEIVFTSSISYNCLGYYAECYALDADGNEISGGVIQVPIEKEVPNTMTPLQMATTIEAIELGEKLPDEAFTITGECGYKFNGGGWDWFVNLYGDKITTQDITTANYMFANSLLETIPFEINGKANKEINTTQMFAGCKKLTSIPKLNFKTSDASSIFSNCSCLEELSEESVKDIDWSYIENLTSAYSGSRSNTFYYCYRLRKFPMSFIAHGNPKVAYSYSVYNSLFGNCFALDEIVNLPVIHREASWTSNAFGSNFVSNCSRLARLTFETNEDGSPIVVNTWSKQTIDLSNSLGYASSSSYFTHENYAPLGTENQVKDDATYQALKNTKDWWTILVDYSRYNHTSAVETINSLPDLSGGAGGNTIKFKGAAGAKTDGGAINTLTAEEIAVATARGWTVTLA